MNARTRAFALDPEVTLLNHGSFGACPRASWTRVLLLGLLLFAAPGVAAGQTSAPDVARRLAEAQRDAREARLHAGIALLAEGGLSTIGGGALALVGQAEPFLVAFGLGSAAWGTVNALLALGLLDLGGGRARAAEATRELRGRPLAEARERTLLEERDTATVFALNLGLDVFYLGSGLLLFFLADQVDGPDDAELLRGYSMAQVGQGGFLLVFDLVEWIAAARRGRRVAALPGPAYP